MGKYSPFARLDGGGMADVFVAVARGPAGFNKLVVIKRLRNAGDPAHVRMFLDEARLSARLSHPNIVNTYEVGETNGNHFMAMEYLDGQPLEALLAKLAARHEALPEPLIAFIGAQALKALHYAHELCDYDASPLGIVHRDVSPQNLFLTFGGEVKLIDFGIAKASVNATRTDTGVLKGKIRYMAPEQVGEKSVDRRVDLFALGVVLWEMLAQRALFDGDSYAVLTRIGSVDAPSVRSVRPEVSAELDAIVARALRRDRDDRYATAAEMQADLERFARGKQDESPDVALARIMNRELEEKRDKVRGRIQAFLAGLDSEAEGPTELGAAVDMLPPLLGEGSGPRRSPLPTTNASLRPSHTSAKTAFLGARRRPRRVGISSAVALIAVAAVVGFIALRAKAPSPPPPAIDPPSAAAPVGAPAQVASTPVVVPVTVPPPSATASVAPLPAATPTQAPPRPATPAPRIRSTSPSPSPATSASASHLKIRVLDDTP
jgi:serine/threonine-protein kinase